MTIVVPMVGSKLLRHTSNSSKGVVRMPLCQALDQFLVNPFMYASDISDNGPSYVRKLPNCCLGVILQAHLLELFKIYRKRKIVHLITILTAIVLQGLGSNKYQIGLV